jgi:Arylsulfatase regulator (Fe-S oxidoreductase)
MITISKMNKEIREVLGLQEYSEDIKYRPILYLVEKEISDGYLIENILTRELILLSKTEYSLFKDTCLSEKSTKSLVQHWFYIPETISEKSIYYILFHKIKHRHPKPSINNKNMFTVFTTTGCNARCPYCYEHGIDAISMNNKVAIDTAKYINISRMPNTKIHLKWFGGEPLLNGDAINTICEYLINANVDFFSSITSNGYLFDKYTNEEIIEKWHLKRVQITLDGTKNFYQKTKQYVNNDNNAFEKVIGNIQRLTDIGVNVCIRMNISSDNENELLSLVDYLKIQFNGNKNLSIYSYILFNEDNPNYIQMKNEQRQLACESFKRIEKKIYDSGFGNHGVRFPSVSTSHCMADNGTSVCITPVGNLTLCEHHPNDEIIGNIYEGITNYATIRSWLKRLPETDKCITCKYYPQCITLKKCPAFSKGCDDFLRLRKEILTKYTMENAYNKYLKENYNEKSNKQSQCRNRVYGKTNTK